MLRRLHAQNWETLMVFPVQNSAIWRQCEGWVCGTRSRRTSVPLISQHVVVTSSCSVTQSWKTTAPLYTAALQVKHSTNCVCISKVEAHETFEVLVFSPPFSAPYSKKQQSGRLDPNLWEWLQFSFTDFGLFYSLRLWSVLLDSWGLIATANSWVKETFDLSPMLDTLCCWRLIQDAKRFSCV